MANKSNRTGYGRKKKSAPPHGIHAKRLKDAIHVPEVPVQECQDHNDNPQHIESTQPQQVKNMILKYRV